jgi:predicted DNA-binding antitoxin AbrB/MazE fold protein
MTIDAVFDGRVFRPIQPIKLPPNTRVQIAVTADERLPVSFLDVAEAIGLEGPPDWSLQLDEYLYRALSSCMNAN